MRQLYEKHLLAYEQHCRAQDARKAAAPVLPPNGEMGDQMAAQILEAMLKAEPEEAAAQPLDSVLEGPPIKRRKVGHSAVQVSMPFPSRTFCFDALMTRNSSKMALAALLCPRSICRATSGNLRSLLGSLPRSAAMIDRIVATIQSLLSYMLCVTSWTQAYCAAADLA